MVMALPMTILASSQTVSRAISIQCPGVEAALRAVTLCEEQIHNPALAIKAHNHAGEAFYQEADYVTAAKHFLEARESFRAGRVAICWYDRRNDPQNLNIERFCAESKNGNEWSNFRVPITPFTPIHRLDLVVSPAYMGDYDGLTSDFTGKTRGFIGVFEWMSSGMNPDVKAFRFE